ncbi:RNA polymerase recycling motor ATPase HelR [Paractinoplanes ferrugineus]|uniref:DNA helicase n=1 Tax=Paractinoplanes ferrugineus TaxID=113564 RepID=A0A919JEM1_9ACTN|nr:DNA helicase [Actinoplanes ferrugineus]
MSPVTASVFDLQQHPAKADPALVADDERHFADIAQSLAGLVAELTDRLDAVRRSAAGKGRQAVDRDQEVRRLSARLRTLRRFSLDLCLGRMVGADGPIYIGRLGLTDGAGRRLLVDWRSPAAEPFFAATHAHPMDLITRRRYRWNRGRVTDYWDEAFSADAPESAALDYESAFITSLGNSREPRMRDVLGTIQADQDAIIRASSSGALIVDGGPGTGKTVVALHRTAYLLYTDPRLHQRRGGVLVVGPHQPYLNYIADVLPSLGEQDVQTCTLRDLVAEGAAAGPESDPAVSRLKSSAAMVGAIEAAVRFYEEPPTTTMTVGGEEADIRVTAREWAAAFEAAEPGTPHNEAREQVWAELIEILGDPSLRQNQDLRTAFNRAWPLLEPTDLVADLWTVPAYLRKCAPWLSPAEVRRLQRPDARAWTIEDLPLLDAARQRLGDAEAARRGRRDAATLAAQRERMDHVVDDLLAANAHDDGEGLWSMLRGADMRTSLVDEAEISRVDPDRLAGPFAHVVVDEAQELTDAQWQMLLLRCPSRSFTIVGDRAQARRGFPESWPQRLARIGLDRTTLASLTINYRTPAEVMAEAEPVIRAVLPDANVPTSIRGSGIPVRHGSTAELDKILEEWLATHDEGTACVIGTVERPGPGRVRRLTPELAKGLEFDLVILVDPESFGDGVEGAVDRYVAMTRATRQLVVLRG